MNTNHRLDLHQLRSDARTGERKASFGFEFCEMLPSIVDDSFRLMLHRINTGILVHENNESGFMNSAWWGCS